MATNDDLLPAGKYELHAQWDELVSKPGQPAEYVRHNAGDIVQLNQEDASRLRKVVAKPGEREKAEAARLQALADDAKARADAAAERVRDAQRDAASATKATVTKPDAA